MGQTQARGQGGEEAAVQYLQSQGYDIRSRNFRCRFGELDVIAQKGQLLCFVEVRMRSTAVWGDPAQTVSWAKQRKVVKTALHYLARHSLKECMLRFDVISVVGQGADRQVEHIPGAFDAGM